MKPQNIIVRQLRMKPRSRNVRPVDRISSWRKAAWQKKKMNHVFSLPELKNFLRNVLASSKRAPQKHSCLWQHLLQTTWRDPIGHHAEISKVQI